MNWSFCMGEWRASVLQYSCYTCGQWKTNVQCEGHCLSVAANLVAWYNASLESKEMAVMYEEEQGIPSLLGVLLFHMGLSDWLVKEQQQQEVLRTLSVWFMPHVSLLTSLIAVIHKPHTPIMKYNKWNSWLLPRMHHCRGICWVWIANSWTISVLRRYNCLLFYSCSIHPQFFIIVFHKVV